MPNEKARKIIKDAMENPEVYRKMAEREAQVWSNFFSSPEKEAIRAKETEANQSLKMVTSALRLGQVLADHGLAPVTGLSLGCGSGRLERQLLATKICQSYHGIDIAADAIQEATNMAQKLSLPLTYETQDLNFVRLKPKSYDLIVAQTSLHHVLHLEHLMDEISAALTDDGCLWVHDYIGESQFQFSDERLKLMNDLLEILPEKLRFNHFAGRAVDKVARKEPGTLVSPFESIRSGEIKGLLLERFDVIVMREEVSFLDRVAGLGMRQNFMENEDTKVIFHLLSYFDHYLSTRGIVPGCLGQFLLKPRR